MNSYYLSAHDEQFKYDCKVINLSYEYPGYTGEEKWAIITDLTEEELRKKYEEIISSYILKGNSDMHTHTFEGGKYAVYHFKGFPQFLFMIYQEAFCRWLSKTGNQLDNRPIFDIYRNIGEDGYMEIDICFPLK